MKNVKHSILQPATFKLDGGAMFGIIPKPLWSKKTAADAENRILLSLRLWLIQTGDRLILTDTGIGDYHNEKFQHQFNIEGPPNPLREALGHIGFNPADVTDLVISHLHFDHIGGLGVVSQNGQTSPLELALALPKARVHLHKKHWEYSKNPTDRDAGSFQAKYYEPLLEQIQNKGQLHLLDGLEGEILKEGDYSLRFKVSHGHTPFLMHPYDDQYIYLADLIPTSHHIPIPWVMGYDIAPGQTTIEKKNLLQWIFEKNLTVIFEHDPRYWGATLKKDEKNHFVANFLHEAPLKSTSFNI